MTVAVDVRLLTLIDVRKDAIDGSFLSIVGHLKGTSTMQGLKSLVGFSRVVPIALIFAFLGQSTDPVLADNTSAPRLVSRLSVDTTFSSSRSVVQTKEIRLACYRAGGSCAKGSDCCSDQCAFMFGHSHSGHCAPRKVK
jgi:hypothetical protein